MTAPGDLGMARAYVSGDLDLHGVHPGDPYDALVLLKDHLEFRAPTPSEALRFARSLGLGNLRPPPPAAAGAPAALAPRSRACGTR